MYINKYNTIVFIWNILPIKDIQIVQRLLLSNLSLLVSVVVCLFLDPFSVPFPTAIVWACYFLKRHEHVSGTRVEIKELEKKDSDRN